MALKLFVDSDVVISSLLSSIGAAFLLIHKTDDINLFISNLSQKELEIVVDRLDISQKDLKSLLEKRFDIIDLKYTHEEISKEYKNYVSDINDAHIIYGAKEAKVRFMITYNLKDYKIEKIKRDLNILVMTPGQFIQYLRSIQ
jgi:predicted nucleic acid-binding protein